MTSAWKVAKECVISKLEHTVSAAWRLF